MSQLGWELQVLVPFWIQRRWQDQQKWLQPSSKTFYSPGWAVNLHTYYYFCLFKQVLMFERKKNVRFILCVGTCIGVLALLVGFSWIYLGLKKRKLIKLKEKFFQQNGGLLLQQQLYNGKLSAETAELFSSEELKKATNSYHESRVLGQGG